MRLLQFFLALCCGSNRVSDIRRIISRQARLIVAVHLHGAVQIAKQAPIVNNQTKIFTCSNSIDTRNCLQQRMFLHRLIDIQHTKRRRIKTSQEHALNDDDIDVFTANNIVFYVFFIIIVLSAKTRLHFFFEEITDDRFVVICDNAFISFFGNRIITNKCRCPHTTKAIDGTFQLYCQCTCRHCRHCLESTRLAII